MSRKTFRNRLEYLAKTYFTGALSPKKLAYCVSFGLLWGVFPLVGTSTLLCTITAVSLRLNIAVVQAVNYLVYPLQFALLIPFLRFGAFLTGSSVKLPSFEEIRYMVTEWQLSEATNVSDGLLQILVNSIVGWAASAPILSLATGSIVYFVFEIRKNKFASDKAR